MPEKKTAVLHVRVPQNLRDRIDRIEVKHGVAMAAQLVDAITALCDAVDREGRYVRPMAMLLGEALPMAAEPGQAAYSGAARAAEVAEAVALLEAKTRAAGAGRANPAPHK